MAIALRLKERRMVAEGTMPFDFEKPADFTYVARQRVTGFCSIPRRPTRKEQAEFYPGQCSV